MSSYAGDSVIPSAASSSLLTGAVYGGKGSKKQRKALAAHTKKVKKAYEKFVKLAKKANKMSGGEEDMTKPKNILDASYSPDIDTNTANNTAIPKSSGGRRHRRSMFKKGSKAARDFMAMLRARRGKSRRGSRRY